MIPPCRTLSGGGWGGRSPFLLPLDSGQDNSRVYLVDTTVPIISAFLRTLTDFVPLRAYESHDKPPRLSFQERQHYVTTTPNKSVLGVVASIPPRAFITFHYIISFCLHNNGELHYSNIFGRKFVGPLQMKTRQPWRLLTYHLTRVRDLSPPIKRNVLDSSYSPEPPKPLITICFVLQDFFC